MEGEGSEVELLDWQRGSTSPPKTRQYQSLKGPWRSETEISRSVSQPVLERESPDAQPRGLSISSSECRIRDKLGWQGKERAPQLLPTSAHTSTHVFWS